MKAIYIILLSISIVFLSGCFGKSSGTNTNTQDVSTQSNKQRDVMLPKALEKYRETIEKSIQPFVRITGKIQTTQPWESKFAGDPYFPITMTYPKDSQDHPMKLLAQINFSEIPDIGLFPESGIVEFFISAYDDVFGMNFDSPTNQENFRVIYIEEVIKDTSKLITDFSFVKTAGDLYFPVEKEVKLSFAVEYKPVPVDDFQFKDFFLAESYDFFEQFGDEEEDLFDFYAYTFSGAGHKLGGYAFFTQTDPRFYINPDYKILLLQIDSDDDVDIMWGDMGVANFFISRKDLENRVFTNVMYNWDCY